MRTVDRRASSFAARISLAAISSWVIGCGGGLPLLHPARVLPLGEVRAAGGVSGNAVLGSASGDLKAALAEAAGGRTPGNGASDGPYAKGALVAAGLAPGVAPFIAARVGVGANAEGGISYTGRGARVDLRRAFDRGAYSLSIGGGITGAFYGTETSGSLPDVQLSQLRGYGADIPILAGWRSAAGIFEVWGGVRGGFEHVAIEQLTSEPTTVSIGVPPIALNGTRFYGGGLVGLAAGFRRVHVAFEVDAAYQSMSGTYDGTHARITGVTLAPATAVWWDF